MPAMILVALLGPGFFEGPAVDFWGPRTAAVAAPRNVWKGTAMPGPARRLLETPSRMNARAYLEWQMERLRKLNAALAALEEVAPRKSGKILYFARKGCGYCDLQEKELAGLPVERVPEGSPLWRAHDVTVTPTLVVGGRTFRGFTPRPALVEGLRRE